MACNEVSPKQASCVFLLTSRALTCAVARLSLWYASSGKGKGEKGLKRKTGRGGGSERDWELGGGGTLAGHSRFGAQRLH